MTTNRRFQRTKENFICVHCDEKVFGNGYTDHCPKCLWSRHVDVNPGDRANNCNGMLEPFATRREGDNYIISHRCEHCGTTKRNKAAAADSFEVILAIGDQPS